MASLPVSNILDVPGSMLAEHLRLALAGSPSLLGHFAVQFSLLADGALLKGQQTTVSESEIVLPMPVLALAERREESRANASRLFAEIAAFEEGAVIQQLTEQFLAGSETELCSPESEPESLTLQSGFIISTMSAYKPIAKLILKQQGEAKDLLDRLVFCVIKSRDPCGPLNGFGFTNHSMLACMALPALAQFIGCSKAFRTELRKRDGLFEAISKLVLSQKNQAPFISANVRRRVAELLHAVASWRDMETWLVGQGYVDAVASLLGTVRSP
jgi:hypothetical protein